MNKKNINLKAGAGKAVLAFPREYFPHENFIDGHDDLHLRILLLETSLRCALISVELPSVRPFELIDGIRSYAGKLLGVDYENVWFVVTHSMAAPHVPQAVDAESEKKQEIHLAVIRKSIEEAGKQALESLQMVRFGYGYGFCDINSNRDIPSAEGWWLGANAPGPSDKTVSVLRFDTMEGKPLAAVYTYAVKTAIIDDEIMSDGYRHYTSDLTGWACSQMEKNTGAVTLYFMGAAGDQVPNKVTKYFETDEKGHLYEVHHGEIGYQWIEELGTVLGSAVEEVFSEISCSITETVLQIKNFSMAFPGQFSIPSELSHSPVKKYDFFRKEDTILDVSMLTLDKVAMIGVKPEYTSITGIELREASPFAQTMLVAMVNGGQGYMADYKAYERITYEGTHSEYACGSAEEFVKRMGGVLQQEYAETVCPE